MGFRTYVGRVSKELYNEIKDLDRDGLKAYYEAKGEIFDEDDEFHKGPYDFGDEIYEFGKWAGFEDEQIHLTPFFTNKEMDEEYNSDYYLKLANAEFFRSVINYYQNMIREQYVAMMEPLFINSGYIGKKDGIYNTRKRSYDKDYTDVYEMDFSNITKEENIALNKMIDHVKSFSMEWGVKNCEFDTSPINFDVDDKRVTTSWKYEYNVFELINIYKNFDWDKNVLVFYGY